MHGQILSNLVGKEGSNAECSLLCDLSLVGCVCVWDQTGSWTVRHVTVCVRGSEFMPLVYVHDRVKC